MLFESISGAFILDLRHNKQQIGYILWSTFFLLFFTQSQIIVAQSITVLPTGFIEEIIVAGLDTPTGFAISPDDRIFFTEKAGTVRVFDRGILQPTPFIDLRHEVNTYRDRGMLGLAVHPNFPAQPYVYVAYVYNPPEISRYDWTGARVSRLVRLEADPENLNRALAEQTTVLLGTNSIFEHIGSPGQPNTYPYACRAANGGFVRDCLPSDGTTHTVGTVLFGKDGSLYVGNGDGIDFGSENMRAQQIDSLAGKILRIDPMSGNGYPDNPFYDGDPSSNRSRVYALGMRNPFRFTLHPASGQLWLGDVGNHTWEEVNNGGAGSNFGWPCYEGFMRAATYPSCQARFSGQITVIQPRYAYPHRGGRSAVIGGDIYQGRDFPSQYYNTYFFADFNDQAIRYLDGDSGEVGTFATNAPGMVQMQDDGSGGLYALYLISGTFTRIRYVGTSNTPPTALLDVDRHRGPEPLTVYFSSARSYDPDGDALRYLWHFGDGTTSSQAEPVHVYGVEGEYTAVLTVTDSKGAIRTDRIQIEVGNAPPRARIHNPKINTRYRIGDRVYFSGAGFDAEDGQLPADHMSWSVYIHHNEHVHYDYFHMAGEAGSFKYEDHEDNTYLQLCLTVTDSDDLSDTTCVEIKAREVTYHFDSVPSGLTLMYAGSRYTTPFSVQTYIRAKRLIGAPRTPMDGRYFDRWSDDGDANHSIKIGPEEKRLVAHYRRVSDKESQWGIPKSAVEQPNATSTPLVRPRPKPTPYPVVIVVEPMRTVVNTPTRTMVPTVTMTPTPFVTPTPDNDFHAFKF